MIFQILDCFGPKILDLPRSFQRKRKEIPTKTTTGKVLNLFPFLNIQPVTRIFHFGSLQIGTKTILWKFAETFVEIWPKRYELYLKLDNYSTIYCDEKYFKVRLIDKFEKTKGMTSLCYRILYRSMDR